MCGLVSLRRCYLQQLQLQQRFAKRLLLRDDLAVCRQATRMNVAVPVVSANVVYRTRKTNLARRPLTLLLEW